MEMIIKYLSGKVFLVVAGLILFTCSCSNETKEYLLTEEMRNAIPFTGKEKVSFLFDGDTLDMISDFRINAQFKTSYGKYNQHYCYVEINEIYFFGKKYTYTYSISNGPDFQHPCELYIDWRYNLSYGSSRLYLKVPLSKKSLNSHQSYIDQLEVLGKIYTGVYCDSEVKSYSTIDYHPTSIYYTKEFGIIRIDFTDGRKWELIGIEWNNLSPGNLLPS
jgi:hypothetical protein